MMDTAQEIRGYDRPASAYAVHCWNNAADLREARVNNPEEKYGVGEDAEKIPAVERIFFH